MFDRRIFERMDVDMPLKFWDIGSNNVGEAETRDASASGLSFSSRDKLSPGAKIGVWLRIPDGKEPLYLRGSIAWSEEEAPGLYRMGFRLSRPELMAMSRIFREAVNFA